MTDSPKRLAKKGFIAPRKPVLAGIMCASLLLGTSAFAGNTTYQYDALGRVIKVTYPDSKQICYAYDSAGNRTQVQRKATGTCSVTGSTLTSSLTAETMLAAQLSSEAQTASVTTSNTDSLFVTDSATTTTSTTDDSTTSN